MSPYVTFVDEIFTNVAYKIILRSIKFLYSYKLSIIIDHLNFPFLNPLIIKKNHVIENKEL